MSLTEDVETHARVQQIIGDQKAGRITKLEADAQIEQLKTAWVNRTKRFVEVQSVTGEI